jgi:Uma2 family endonuclease
MPKTADRMATPTRSAATEDDLRRMPEDGQKYELVDGEIRVSPTGARHGQVAVNLVFLLVSFVRKHRLGHVLDSSSGFRLPGGNVRSPDVSFVARGRFPGEQVPEDFSEVVPDLAVEVLSPRDRSRDVLDKVGEYLQVGVRMVLVIDPKRGRAAAYKSLTDVTRFVLEDVIPFDDVLPGLSLRLSEILEQPSS